MMCIIGYQLLSGFVLPGPRVDTSGILKWNARRFPRFVGIGSEISASPELGALQDDEGPALIGSGRALRGRPGSGGRRAAGRRAGLVVGDPELVVGTERLPDGVGHADGGDDAGPDREVRADARALLLLDHRGRARRDA